MWILDSKYPFLCGIKCLTKFFDYRWMDPSWIIPTNPTSASCVKITPDKSKSYVQDGPLLEGRTMANLIFLPDGKILCLNGAGLGTA